LKYAAWYGSFVRRYSIQRLKSCVDGEPFQDDAPHPAQAVM
jgi:hypothetical protein